MRSKWLYVSRKMVRWYIWYIFCACEIYKSFCSVFIYNLNNFLTFWWHVLSLIALLHLKRCSTSQKATLFTYADDKYRVPVTVQCSLLYACIHNRDWRRVQKHVWVQGQSRRVTFTDVSQWHHLKETSGSSTRKMYALGFVMYLLINQKYQNAAPDLFCAL